VGAREALRTRVLPTAADSLTDKAAARARADLDAVLSGGWADIDLAPVNALATALNRHHNVSRLRDGTSNVLLTNCKARRLRESSRQGERAHACHRQARRASLRVLEP
jgi:hypothetical protein